MMPHSETQHNNGRRRRTGSRDALKQSLSIPLFRGDSSNSNSSSAEPSRQTTPNNMHSMLEPAIDGPPSPERLRQLSKQMKRASHLNRSMGHRSPSSGSPALRSAAEHPPWEQALADMSLNRRPSNRSISSSIPSRERPDSVQALGKDLFRRTKIKRASSSYSSSNSSMYSAEVPNDGLMVKDSLIPTLFARRKPSRDESVSEKKLQISGPFNFQHVAHTQRDNVPHMRVGSQGEVTDEFAHLPTPGPMTAPGTLQIEAQDLPYPGYSNGEEYDEYDDMPFTAPPTRPNLHHHHTAPTSAPRRVIKQAKSQDQLRSMFPFDSSMNGGAGRRMASMSESHPSAPVPPPRKSSHQSLAPEGFSAFADGSLDRPRTNVIRQPQPYDPAESMEEPPPEFLDDFAETADLEAFGLEERRYSHAITTSEEVSWPLAAPGASPTPVLFEKGLPDVPEEEESQQFQQAGRSHHKSRASRASLASNSSLRGSQSVPALRRFSQSNRRMSGASDTLGRYDMAAAHRATRADQIDDADVDPLAALDNWEDDIDYCYEHEADANFDYNWERSSLDVQRGEVRSPIKVIFEDDELAEMKPSQPEMFGSSGGGAREGLSPGDNLGVTNFSFPRGDKASRVPPLRPIRPVSYASTFKESHGFNLSPSLLIPGDYAEMMDGEHDQYEPQDDVLREAYQGPYHSEDSPFKMNKSPLSYAQRSSTSTTGSAASSQFDSAGERHTSTNSNFTALTRFTVSSTSSTSLNKVSGVVTETKEPMPVTTFIDINDDSDEEEEEDATPPASKDTVPELTPFPMTSANKKPLHKSHASESLLRDDVAPMRSQDAAKMRRPRARTSSLSAQVPPVGQYALFPRSYAKESKPTGDNRI